MEQVRYVHDSGERTYGWGLRQKKNGNDRTRTLRRLRLHLYAVLRALRAQKMQLRVDFFYAWHAVVEWPSLRGSQ